MLVWPVKALTVLEVLEFCLRVEWFLLHCDHNVLPFIVQPFESHGSDEVDESVRITEEHVDWRHERERLALRRCAGDSL